jgi:hypothetical protein
VTSLAMAVTVAATSTLGQVLPPVATVVAAVGGALITGFGAAGLKHKWDIEADDKRWRRNRDARVRAQRLDAFAQYLSARPDLRAVKSLLTRAGDPAAIVSGIRLATANLLIVLSEPEQRTIVERDLLTVEDWVASWLDAPANADRTDVPSAQPILDLARNLVVEPGPQARPVAGRGNTDLL